MGDNGGNGQAYEEMERRVRGIKRKAACFTLVALGFNAALYAALLWWLKDTKRANEVFTNTFQYQVVGWCAIFMYPYFLRMEVKTDLGLQQGRDVAATLSQLKVDLKPIIDDAKAIVHDLRAAVEKYSRDDVVSGVIAEIRKELDSEGGVIKRLEGKFDEIVRVFSAPVGARPPGRPGLLERGLKGAADGGPGNGAEPARAGAEGGERGA